MSQLSRVASVTAAGWRDLADELDRWREAGRTATLWWRDDDAAMPSERLDRLVSIAGKVPIMLAVIPAAAEPELAGWLSQQAPSGSETGIAVLQHGWRHSNHSLVGKKSEFPAERSFADVIADLAAGRERLTELFGPRALPVLVPPWNRFDDAFLPVLAGCGIRGISRAKARRAEWAIPGLLEVNVHVDLVAWASDRGFVGERAALGGLVGHLRARRFGAVCADEPTGILTHHLVQDEAAGAFLCRLLGLTGAHGAARWLDAAEIFASAVLAPA